MGNRNLHSTSALLISIILCLSAGARSQDKERPKLKDFGVSLKRANRDPQKKALEPISKSNSKSESDLEVIKIETSLVSNDLLVMDSKGNFVSGLSEKDFVITEDGQPQQVGMFSTGDDARVARSIVLIIDYSGSQFPYIQNSVAAAKNLVDKLPDSDSMAIVTDDVELLQDFTRDKRKLKSKLDSLLARTKPVSMENVPFPIRHFGKSQQYSALLATLNEAFNNEDQRPIVIFQTDGDQLAFLRNSPIASIRIEGPKKRMEPFLVNFSLDDICRAAEKARATIYTVVPGRQLINRSPAEQQAITKAYMLESPWGFGSLVPEVQQNAASRLPEAMVKEMAENRTKMQTSLAEVSTASGGWTMFLEKPSDADHIYSSILADMNRRYIVGYYPANKEHDGKRRKLDITVRDHADYVVLGRRWYFAPAPDQ